MGYWDDYIRKMPGTPGGEQARLEDIRAQSAFPDYSGRKTPRISDPPPPRIKRPLTKIDFIIGGVVFVVTWMMLAASSTMDGGVAFTVAFFASAIAGMWWRSLVFIAVVVVVLIFLVSVLK
jgi:hypothetical protein